MIPTITGIGANVYDTLIQLPRYPVEDTKAYVDAVLPSGGGPCATGLVAAARLGAEASWIGILSDDVGGRFLLDDFKRYGVGTDLIRIAGEGRSFSATVLLSTESGSRTCLLDRGDLPALELDAKQVSAIEASEILLVDGNELDAAVRGAEIARNAGKHVLYDAGGLYPDVERLLALADILIPSEEFAKGLTAQTNVEDAAKTLFERFEPDVVVVTRGKNGGILYRGDRIVAYPAFQVDVVDSNGAGDVFHGAFAFAAARGMPYEKCCVFASAVSALKCTRLGARRGIPGFELTMNFLKEQGIDEL